MLLFALFECDTSNALPDSCQRNGVGSAKESSGAICMIYHDYGAMRENGIRCDDTNEMHMLVMHFSCASYACVTTSLSLIY